MKNPSSLNDLLAFALGAGIDLSHINDLACRFKSPATTYMFVSGRKISQTAGSLRGIAAYYFIAFDLIHDRGLRHRRSED
jgi:hypothetical protein